MKRKICWMLLSLAVWVVPSFAATPQPDRIHGAITNTPSIVLKGNVHPKAQPQYDQGPVEPTMRLGYITMVLQSSAAQQADLKQFLQDLQNPSSPSYHKWLTPEKYAARFGVSQHDMTKIMNWLTAQGFEVIQPARGRNWIAFAGTAELVSQVFQTQIHYYNVDGEKHFANSTALSIPQALSGMVIGFRNLNDFRPKPMGIKRRAQNGVVNPDYSSGGFNNLAPADIATIYNVQALYNTGITGSGQKIVVVGQTDINTADIAAFRSGFGLSATLPTSMLVTGDTDPGTTGDLGEADLDLEWVGAVAQNASIIFVIGGVASGQGGVFDSAQFAIDNNLAPVISMSYGGCESSNVTFIPFFEPELKKASTQGITFLASSGDSGAAGCDSNTATTATKGLAVNYPASSPEVTGVGGNEFNEGTGTYWGSNGGNLGSALTYIPETGWNDTAINGSLASTGGGKSSCGVESGGACTGGFPKPSWQVGTGVPADSVRDVPDVSMAASADHDGYIFCTAGSCALGIAMAVQQNSIVGGTSASTPVFAGVITLLNDYISKHGGTAGQGNINQKLYQLASSPNVFHDVTTGNNIVPCTQGTTGCPASAPFQYGYSAGVGYDQVTGLGSVDTDAFVLAFAGNNVTTTTTLTLAPPPTNGQYVGSSQIVSLTATVTPSSGTMTPTGTITFMDNGTTLGNAITLLSGSANLANQTLAGGSHSLTAVYSGDANFPGSTSAATSVLVTLNTPNTTSLQLSSASVNAGSSVTFTGMVAPTGGGTTPTGSVSFMNGSTLLGSGTLSAGVATFSTSALAGGTYNVTANYSGDATYGITSSSASALNVMDFTIPTTATILVSAPGQSGMTTLTATLLGGFTGTIAYSCTGAPSEATCTVAATSTGATVTVTTTAAHSNLIRPGKSNGILYAMLLPGLLGLVLASRKKRAFRRGAQLLSLVVILGLSTLWMSACGGSSSSGGTPNPGTPTGTSTLTVTATSGTLAPKTSTITLTIQ